MTSPMDGSRLDYALELAVRVEIWRREIEAMGWTVTESSGQTVWPVRDWAGRLQIFFSRTAGSKMVWKRVIVRTGEDMDAVKSRLLKEMGSVVWSRTGAGSQTSHITQPHSRYPQPPRYSLDCV